MNIKTQFEKYIPYNEQEEKDKEMILKYIDVFDDVLTRNNEIAHFTCSSLILNKERDKVLLVHHNIFNSWAWTGGHADGDTDFLGVAIREAKEETGVKNVTALSDDIFTIDILTSYGHIKRGKYVPAHIHLSVAYLLEANEDDVLHIKEDENSNVAWLPIDNFLDLVVEENMKPAYKKMIDKAKDFGYL